jgi:hypothetical protein
MTGDEPAQLRLRLVVDDHELEPPSKTPAVPSAPGPVSRCYWLTDAGYAALGERRPGERRTGQDRRRA